MSHRSNIGYVDEETQDIIFVYCQNWGEIEMLGKDLLIYFPTLEDAKELVKKGNMSSIIKPYTCLGEPIEKNLPKKTKKINEVHENEYSYVFSGDKWLASTDGKKYKDLVDLVYNKGRS